MSARNSACRAKPSPSGGRYPEFRTAYVEAFRARSYGFAEEGLDILDAVAGSNSLAEVTAARARADFRRWISSRLISTVFGDQLQHTLAGGAVITIALPERARRLFSRDG